jgi:hypothetical protein
MGHHARLSPSGAYRWTECTASPGASDGLPNDGTEAARVGTVCHQIQEECLLDPSRDLMSYLGRVMVFWIHPESDSNGENWRDEIAPNGEPIDPCLEFAHEVEVTEEMLDAVASALAFITEQVELLGGHLLVEQRVPIGQFTGEEGATGSADVIIL